MRLTPDAREGGRRACSPRGYAYAVFRALTLSLVAFAFVLPTVARAASAVYVAELGETATGEVAQYALGPAGALSPLSPATVASGFGGSTHVTVGPDGKSVYVTNQGNFANVGSVSQYTADPSTGALSLKSPPSVPAGLGATGVVASPDGKNVYVTNIGTTEGGSASQYSVDPVTGTLSPKAPSTIAAGRAPLGITVAPDGRSVYVANNAGRVSQFTIDPTIGGLSPKTPASVAAGVEPNEVAVTPNGKSAYVPNYDGGGPGNGGGPGSVSQYNIDPVTGALSPKTPATVATGLGPLGVAVTPDGRNAYVTDLIDNTVSQYTIDPSTGELSPKTPPTVATGQGPCEVAVAADGKSAYITNSFEDAVSQYDIDQVTGTLTPKNPATVATGFSPRASPRAHCRACRQTRASARTAAGATSRSSTTRVPA